MDNQKITNALNLYIKPQSFPVAVKMYVSLDDLPEKIKVAGRDLKMQLTNCQAMGMARLQGRSIAITADDVTCPFGAVTLGFLPPKEGFLDGSVAAKRSFQSKEAEARNAQGLCRFKYQKYTAAVYAPLERALFQPDVIVIYGNSAQMMRLVQGYLYQTGGYLNSQLSGCFDCADSVTKAIITGEPQVVLPSNGARVFGGAKDSELIFSMPYQKTQQVLEGLKRTHDSGFWRYPIPSYLHFKAKMPPHEAELLGYLKE